MCYSLARCACPLTVLQCLLSLTRSGATPHGVLSCHTAVVRSVGQQSCDGGGGGVGWGLLGAGGLAGGGAGDGVAGDGVCGRGGRAPCGLEGCGGGGSEGDILRHSGGSCGGGGEEGGSE